MSRKERYLTYIRKYRECTEDKNMLEASCILEKVVELRFDNTLKQYNGDINRAWDNYSVSNILNQVALYVNEFYETSNDNKPVKKNMNRIINNLWYYFNNGESED